MRPRSTLLTLCLCLALPVIGCTSKPSSNGTTSAVDTGNSTTTSGNAGTTSQDIGQATKVPIVVPAGTTVTVRLSSALGSRLSQPGQTFHGSLAKDILVGGVVAIPQGAKVRGTVTDAQPLGKLAGGAVLQVRLDSINLNGINLPVHVALRTFSVKGKGKRTGVMAGGGAVFGGIIGAIAGRGKGAAVGAAAGGAAGAGGSAVTGNNDIVLAAESALSFQLSQPLAVSP